MLKLSQPIMSINGFKIGDKVRLKDGDGRPHIIKSFSIDGMKEFFFQVQFEDETETMLDNITPLPSNLDEAAHHSAVMVLNNPAFLPNTPFSEILKILDGLFKAGAEWMAKQGETINGTIFGGDGYLTCETDNLSKDTLFKYGDKVIVQIRKK